MKTLKKIVAVIGPLGCVAVCCVAVVLLRGMMHNMHKMAEIVKPELKVSVDTMIEGIRETGVLKPYKVITGGFGKESRKEGEKSATLEYQYKGFAEYSVDLTRMTAAKEEGKIIISLSTPKLEPPHCLKMKSPRLWKVDADIGMGHWKDRFRQEEPEIVDKQLRADCDKPENVEKAKRQTEVILRYMFSVVMDKNNVVFKWK